MKKLFLFIALSLAFANIGFCGFHTFSQSYSGNQTQTYTSTKNIGVNTTFTLQCNIYSQIGYYSQDGYASAQIRLYTYINNNLTLVNSLILGNYSGSYTLNGSYTGAVSQSIHTIQFGRFSGQSFYSSGSTSLTW